MSIMGSNIGAFVIGIQTIQAPLKSTSQYNDIGMFPVIACTLVSPSNTTLNPQLAMAKMEIQFLHNPSTYKTFSKVATPSKIEVIASYPIPFTT